jgi:hypothetical protein
VPYYLFKLQLPAVVDKFLVTAFAEANGKGCAGAIDLTLRVLFDGQAMAEYPPMTSTLTPGTYIQPGLGGPVAVHDYYYLRGRALGGPVAVHDYYYYYLRGRDQRQEGHQLTLEAAGSGAQPVCVSIEDRNINTVGVGS